MLLIIGLYPLMMTGLMLHGSLVQKVRDADRTLDLITWSGDEHVLDVGCGRGLMLVTAARRLTGGQAIGIDIWQTQDQAGNAPETPVVNAREAGVADRVTVMTADMRTLPFDDASFDVIVSNWTVHNLEEAADRKQALIEMNRVLRPGATILLTDIANRDEYAEALTGMGLSVRIAVVSRFRDLFLRVVTFGSFSPATVVARKIA